MTPNEYAADAADNLRRREIDAHITAVKRAGFSLADWECATADEQHRIVNSLYITIVDYLYSPNIIIADIRRAIRQIEKEEDHV